MSSSLASAFTILVVSPMAACGDGSPPPPPQATLTFTDPGPAVTGDTPSSMSSHLLKVCVLAATRITFAPPLAPGTHAKISIQKFGGADGTLGNTGSPLNSFEQD